jgi:hypothetical protein
MPIQIGNQNIGEIKVGNQIIKEVFVGTQQVYGKEVIIEADTGLVNQNIDTGGSTGESAGRLWPATPNIIDGNFGTAGSIQFPLVGFISEWTSTGRTNWLTDAVEIVDWGIDLQGTGPPAQAFVNLRWFPVFPGVATNMVNIAPTASRRVTIAPGLSNWQNYSQADVIINANDYSKLLGSSQAVLDFWKNPVFRADGSSTVTAPAGTTSMNAVYIRVIYKKIASI